MNAHTKDHDISTLNHLTSLCMDSARGYREAAEKSDNTSLAQMFRSRAAERDQVVSEFQSEVRNLGGTANDHGTVAGSAHRLVLDVMAMIGDNAKAAITEVERGEDVIKAAFEKATRDMELSQTVKSMIQRTYTTIIKTGHDQMSSLKHSVA